VGGRPFRGGRNAVFSSSTRWLQIASEPNVSHLWDLSVPTCEDEPISLHHDAPIIQARLIADDHGLIGFRGRPEG
jgi:hypothetical protein